MRGVRAADVACAVCGKLRRVVAGEALPGADLSQPSMAGPFVGAGWETGSGTDRRRSPPITRLVTRSLRSQASEIDREGGRRVPGGGDAELAGDQWSATAPGASAKLAWADDGADLPPVHGFLCGWGLNSGGSMDRRKRRMQPPLAKSQG